MLLLGTQSQNIWVNHRRPLSMTWNDFLRGHLHCCSFIVLTRASYDLIVSILWTCARFFKTMNLTIKNSTTGRRRKKSKLVKNLWSPASKINLNLMNKTSLLKSSWRNSKPGGWSSNISWIRRKKTHLLHEEFSSSLGVYPPGQTDHQRLYQPDRWNPYEPERLRLSVMSSNAESIIGELDCRTKIIPQPRRRRRLRRRRVRGEGDIGEVPEGSAPLSY